MGLHSYGARGSLRDRDSLITGEHLQFLLRDVDLPRIGMA
jgi:hypothetical protein